MLFLDKLIGDFDRVLRVVSGQVVASRPNPARQIDSGMLSAAEQRHSAGLMRVNHVGEVCAQALYDAQARLAQNDLIKQKLLTAGCEEADHLGWTAERLQELGSHVSVLNPLWYVGSYMIGSCAASLGDVRSMSFMLETERQVEAHLRGHLEKLPSHDTKSRAIVEQMCVDEVAHGEAALELGAIAMPLPCKKVMQAMSAVMTRVAYYI